MKELSYILILMAFLGGLSTFWAGFSETFCAMFGCMRYTYDVTIFEHGYEDSETYTLETRKPQDEALRSQVEFFLARKHPEIMPFTIVSIMLVKKRSVLMQTICRWLYRACTRSADDAVREWKERNGMAV